MILHQRLICDEGFFDMGFLLEWVEPSISGKVVYKDEVVFEVVDKENG